MGFGYIAVGLWFLFNPNISVLDVLPDFIGYLLIFRGLFQMSFSSPALQEVRGSMGKLALITALRLLSFILLPYTSETFGLVLVFVFGVLEAIYFIPAVTGLFEGFYNLGIRHGVDSVFDTRTVQMKVRVKNASDSSDGKAVYTTETRKREFAERLKVYTIVFFLIKTVGAVLPELTVLQTGEGYSTTTRFQAALTQFKPLFRGFCFLIVLVFGVIWLIRFLRYIRLLRRDAVLCEGIEEYYRANIASRPAVAAALRMKKVHVLLIAAAVFTMIFLIEGMDRLPNALASACVILALLMMRRDAENAPLVAGGIAVSAAAALLSVVNLFIQNAYFDEYEAAAARHIAGAAEKYTAVRFWGAAEYILVILMFAVLFAVYCRVLKKHASYVSITGNASQYSADARRAELLSPVYNRVLLAGIVGVLYGGLGAAFFTVSMYFAEMFMVNAVVCIFWIASVVRVTLSAYESIYERLELNY